jgi:hypothetical protein
MAITRSTLGANIHTTLKNSVDAVYAAWGVTTFVQAFPEEKKVTKTNFPILVKTPAEIQDEELFFTRSKNLKTISVMFEIHTRKASQIDSISDSLRNHLETTKFDGISLVESNDSSVGTTEINQISSHFKIMSFVYRFK